MIYLDIILIVNGAMDAFLLLFTAYLLRKKISGLNLFLAVLLGEIPVFLILFDLSAPLIAAKVIIPVAMVGLGLKTKSFGELARGVLYFSLLAAVSGGIYFALSAWFGLTGGENSFLNLRDLWFLPMTALVLMAGYKFWEKSLKTNLYLDNVLYDAELCFEPERKLKVKALLDTGNELRDPLTGTPVMLLEERAAQKVLPEKIKQFLQLPWQESPNPWSYLWQDEESSLHKLVFIAAKGINGQTWLLGIRLGQVKFSQGDQEWEHPATVALVPQTLSTERKFQALLHPEHIQKLKGKEEIA
ncbi:MAG TPA: sigma-E processing peptidase SpoIIGA [Peptococcaceae bacterium]|nr:sigma-E processing peptidase SpoIIGA [Peptococcaceae bacterium]